MDDEDKKAGEDSTHTTMTLQIETVINTEFLKRLRTIWRYDLVGERLLTWKWLYEQSCKYLDKYGEAPGLNINSIFAAEAPRMDPETRKAFSDPDNNKPNEKDLFCKLNEQYEELEARGKRDIEYLWDRAKHEFERRAGQKLSEGLEIAYGAYGADDLEEANRLLQQHNEYLAKLHSTSGTPLTAVTARELQQMDLPEPEWIVRGVIPVGFTLLSGKPKTGKSYLALNIAVQLALGSKVFNIIETEPTEVVYLGLEEPAWMTKRRIGEIIGDDGNWPDNLHFFYEWPKLHEGGLTRLEQWMKEHPNTGLIIIDTFQKVRKPPKARGNPYPEDYEAGCVLHELAKKHSIGVTVIHHNKKTKEADVFDEISGSTGLVASTDSNLNFRKIPGPNQNLRQLHYQGRMLMEGVLELTFDNHRFYLDDEPPGNQELPKRKISPARQAILDVLEDQLWYPYEMGRKELIKAVGNSAGKGIEMTLSQMVENGQIIRVRAGVYIHPDNFKKKNVGDMCRTATSAAIERRKRRNAAMG